MSGKLNQSITVQIMPVDGVPDRDDQDLRLRAEVTLNRPVDQEVKFQWTLPPEASLVSGEIEDAWPNLLPGQTATTEIVVQGVSKESLLNTVTLHVSALSQGVRYASAGSFAPNSVEASSESESIGVMKVQKPQLGLKKAESAGKLIKIHQ